MFYGLLNLTFWEYIIYALIVTHITIVSVTIFLHRCQAHRALELHPLISHCFRFWLWITTGMETKAWAAIHRKHHAYCETPDDPHSPQILGLKTVLLYGAELYRMESKNKQTLDRFGSGTPADWLERNVYAKHSAKGILLMLAIDLLLLGVPGIAIWALQMAWIPLTAAGIVNGVGHYYGYRNFEYPDASTNIIPWGIIIGGEELHNNHHTYPTSAKLSIKWWEFDIGWIYIKLLSLLGLAKVKRLPPVATSVPGKSTIDAETLIALIHNRFQVISEYTKNVVLPVFNQAKANSSAAELKSLLSAKQALIRDGSLVDDADKKSLEHVLNSNKLQVLQVVYNFQQQLQTIWNKTTASQKELIEDLHEWCRSAEATRIKYLHDFAAYIKGYKLQINH